MRLWLFVVILWLAALPVAAQEAAAPAVGGTTPGIVGVGQVGSGVVTLPKTTETPAPEANPNNPPGSTTLTSTNPPGASSAASGAAGGAATAGTVTGPGAITTGTTAIASVPHVQSRSTEGIGAVVTMGTASVPSSNGTASTTTARSNARSGATSGGAAATAGTTANGSANNVTSAASAGHSAPTFLCLSGSPSEIQPFLTGTGLSCAP